MNDRIEALRQEIANLNHFFLTEMGGRGIETAEKIDEMEQELLTLEVEDLKGQIAALQEKLKEKQSELQVDMADVSFEVSWAVTVDRDELDDDLRGFGRMAYAAAQEAFKLMQGETTATVFVVTVEPTKDRYEIDLTHKTITVLDSDM